MQGSYSLQPMPLMTWNDKRDSIIQNHALLGSAVTFLKKHPFIKKKGLFFYLQNVPFMDLAFFFALSGNYIFFVQSRPNSHFSPTENTRPELP